MKYFFTISFLLHFLSPSAQQTVSDDILNEDQLEELTESAEEEPEDDYDIQQLVFFKDHPVDINGDASTLEEFPMLSSMQITHLIKYRQLLGNLVNIYELQAVPGFTVDQIKKILPYITINTTAVNMRSLSERIRNGRRLFILRPSLVPETARGFNRADSSAGQYFTGNGLRLFFRYSYNYRNLLQYGITGDKDAGEPLAFTKSQSGFDFYSFHVFIRNAGIIKSFAIGDYSLNLGQGLIHWQSQAFKKSSGVINIKRQGEILRPYNSAGEYNFLRGLAVTFKKKDLEATFFSSIRNVSANISYDNFYGEVISSIQTSGLHRTANEIADKASARIDLVGGNIRRENKRGHMGINAVSYMFSVPLLKRDEPYNLYAIKGKRWGLLSFDYDYTFRNCHVFGEIAMDKRGNPAFINALIASLGAPMDIALVHRSINKEYQTLSGNAFTENSFPTNENGLYIGVSVKPWYRWRIDLYADVFSFAWLKYRLDVPGQGSQYLIQINWKPDKKVEVYSRLRIKNRQLNIKVEGERVNIPESQMLKNWRTHASFQAGRNILLRNRLEVCWFSNPFKEIPETGFLIYSDLLYKPNGSWYSVSLRFQAFETDGYDTRLYAYENDLLFSSSTPSFYDKGIRCYVNFKGKIRLKFLPGLTADLGLKAGMSIFNDKKAIGSGPDQIPGNRRSEVRFQAFFHAA